MASVDWRKAYDESQTGLRQRNDDLWNERNRFHFGEFFLGAICGPVAIVVFVWMVKLAGVAQLGFGGQ